MIGKVRTAATIKVAQKMNQLMRKKENNFSNLLISVLDP
jgi:hypothetical protein